MCGDALEVSVTGTALGSRRGQSVELAAPGPSPNYAHPPTHKLYSIRTLQSIQKPFSCFHNVNFISAQNECFVRFFESNKSTGVVHASLYFYIINFLSRVVN